MEKDTWASGIWTLSLLPLRHTTFLGVYSKAQRLFSLDLGAACHKFRNEK